MEHNWFLSHSMERLNLVSESTALKIESTDPPSVENLAKGYDGRNPDFGVHCL